MGKYRGFIEYGREEAAYRDAKQRVKDFEAVELHVTDEDIRRQSARCMDCGIPFCHGCGCPLENLIPEWNDLVYRNRWQEALDLLLATNPFPEFTGRICPAPCEAACVLDINDDPVTIRLIELAIVEKAYEVGYIRPRPPDSRRDERVAIVGSGPAGLCAADILNRQGFNIVVYENAARVGGILRYGIPDFKLEKWVVDRRIALMEEEGVVFETNVEIGSDISERYLKDRFDAVILTGGAREPRDLQIPGRELKGIEFAMPFLVHQNMVLNGEVECADPEASASGKRVVIIGGGDTGSDCLGTTVRQGAVSVEQFEILPEPPATRSESTPWPGWPLVLRTSSSHKEGGTRRWSVVTKEFVGEDGHVTGLRGVEVDWVAGKDGGRPAPVEMPGTEFSVRAELVLLAMGFVGPGRNLLVERLGIELNDGGFVRRDGNAMTSCPGVFVAGDMTQGASLVVRAMMDGIQTAHGVAAYLAVGRGK